MTIDEIKKLIKEVPDFPKSGVLFKDITPILENGTAFKKLAQYFAENIDPSTTKLAAIESRGFILGAAVAQYMDCGMVLVRKPGKLPRPTFKETYDLEYGQDTLAIHKDALTVHDRVTIIDDVLATGGTASAVEKLCEKTGATILGHIFLLEVQGLNGRKKLSRPAHVLF